MTKLLGHEDSGVVEAAARTLFACAQSPSNSQVRVSVVAKQQILMNYSCWHQMVLQSLWSFSVTRVNPSVRVLLAASPP